MLDLDMDRAARKKVIPSAICRVDGGIVIGDEAFEHATDNEGIRVCFKQKPESIDGENESLMVDYMRTIYGRIREVEDRLTDDNHIVYIARPSGWQDEPAKELYRKMAVKAGIPLGGLTSESRAAIFYAKSPRVGFANEISKGAIVFDLGSSTVDFTYLSDKDKPVDNGYNLGASIIDDVIYQSFILKDEEVADFIKKYPEYEGTLRFKARKFKESAYSRSAESKTIESFDLDSVILPQEPAYEEFGDAHVKMKINNIHELNDLIEKKRHYVSDMKSALEDYRDKTIPGKKINGVFLTGGASRMNFIQPLIAETLGLPLDRVKFDKENPSLTISRGIAMLGTADAVTNVLVSKLKESIPEFMTNAKLFDPLVDALSQNITEAAWDCVASSCEYWVKNGETTDRDELKQTIEKRLKDFNKYNLRRIVNNTIQAFVKDESETIRKEMNKIISRYAPGQEITLSGNIGLGNQQAITESLKDMNDFIQAISKGMGAIIADILWAALAVILWGVLAAPYYILRAIFTSDESRRKDKAKDILDKELEIRWSLRDSIKDKLKANSKFKSEVTNALQRYFSDIIDQNLQKVIIPIE